MKVTYRINASTTLEQECPTLKVAFKFLAYAQEVFGPRLCPESGASDNHRLKFRISLKDGKKCEYYSLEDMKTGWEFKFGQKQDDGSLFPKGWEPPFQREEKSKSQQQSRSQNSDEGELVGAGVSEDCAF